MVDFYNTIDKQCVGSYKDKGSKFFSYAIPMNSKNDFEQAISILKKEHPKSRHICFAYAYGIDEEYTRSNDDGEPSNSAGRPILNVIRSAELKNTAIFVVRYFGGTKLGLQGLIKAYKTAAKYALDSAIILQKRVQSQYSIICELHAIGELYAALKKNPEIRILETYTSENFNVEVEIPRAENTSILNKMNATFHNLPLEQIESGMYTAQLKITEK